MLHPVPTNSSVKASACAELRTNLGKKIPNIALLQFHLNVTSRSVSLLLQGMSAQYALVTWILYTALPL